MNFANSGSSPGFLIKQLPLSLYTARTNVGSSEPAATTMGMCIKAGVDLITFKTFSPDILGCDKSKKMRSGTPTSAYLPSRRTYMRASSPSVTQRRPLVNPATLNASTVSNVSAGLLCTMSTSRRLADLTASCEVAAIDFNLLSVEQRATTHHS